MKLLIGSKAFSSWSLRPWFLLKEAGIAFEEILVPLYRENTEANIRAYSPTGKVPCLMDGVVTVWESIAICEYLAEQFPEKRLWPETVAARAEARALAAEMHAGFAGLRSQCAMDLLNTYATPILTADTAKDLARIAGIWEDLRGRHARQGPYLFGNLSIVDAMFLPVATRCRTHALPLPERAQAWADFMLARPAVQQWYADARQEA